MIGRAECIGEIPKDNGAKCCILDNNTNKFAVIPVMPAKEVQAMLSQMGYSEVSAKEIADKVTASYRENDIGYGEQFIKMLPVTGDLKRYDAELRDMGYCNNKDSTIIIRDDAENYRYMQVERNTPLADAEKAFREDFGLVDDISVACAMKQLIADNIVNDAHTYEHSEASIKQLSGNMAEITAKESGKSEIMAIGNINAEKLAELGISEKGAADISRSFEKSIRDSKFPDRQTLGGLKQFAQEKFKELSQTVKDKIISKGKGGQEL